jgi:hypothetical protein
MKTIAGLVILLLIVGYAAVASTPSTSPVETKAQGRYQLVLNPNVRADVFLLDTQTGKIWTPVEITNVKDERTKAGSPTVWMYQEKIDNKADWNRFMESHPAKEELNSKN